jgi:flagellar hook-basal body complex protein FliE
MAVSGIGSFNVISPVSFDTKKILTEEPSAMSFGEFLQEALNKVSELQVQSEKLNEDFAAGRTDSIHEVMIATEKADIALQFTMQIRNKILDAYNEIMRMPV